MHIQDARIRFLLIKIFRIQHPSCHRTAIIPGVFNRLRDRDRCIRILVEIRKTDRFVPLDFIQFLTLCWLCFDQQQGIVQERERLDRSFASVNWFEPVFVFIQFHMIFDCCRKV